ncbi:MAG: hypothetical protein US68_C0013G0006 [Candidatus Shapirobacteria bacterium GW2011_GWE1_38_10]|uniref:Uncharacterized protein n=1 Tax=Candidatus Shapirobacteria bacterium GW2011_GWE1_38_10 TaxID=1618488 RepID=A0A0G0LA80_9BACT|nr:MAG: hypothetical protein US46_C0010G0031 [Candidatus Shapirobacteria bacterium GW2011_GWF2_37_20]KKQ49566.1 MAG: hypothetical protein US68_C0013G0006 [Candidatus Shapirobacteria bacterium GW2011_GWE1_38_10]HBP51293.1 hypothetical protein [Candidatus Shapirobacteria bacterium]
MTEKLKDLYLRLNRPIIGRVLRQFGNFNVDQPIDQNKSDSQLFNELIQSRGKGKPRSEKGLRKKANQMRNS